MLWVSFSVCLEQNMKRAEQFWFVSNVMKSDHARSLRRYGYVKGNLISLNGFPLLQVFFFILILYSYASLSLAKLYLNSNLPADTQYILPIILGNH